MPETLYIIDTFSLVFQVFHAIRQPMTGTRGQPTNAIFGFTGDLQHLLKDKQPTHLICAMESEEPQERVAMYADYKAHREEMPQDLRAQIPLILEVVQGYRIPIISCPGWEADDVIATLARQAEAAGMEVRIVTSDKDARQLITPHVKIYSIRKKQFLDEAGLLEDWGIRPDQVIDFQALVGDSVDNVPGVPQVGPKTAATLLQKFDTLEEVLKHPDQAPGKKVQENLRKYAEQALLSRELVRLRTDLPLQFDWEQARVSTPDYQKLYDLFVDFGFRRYAAEMQTALKESQQVTEKGAHPREWVIVRNARQFEELLNKLQGVRRICIDLETTSINPVEAEIVGWALCWEADTGYYIAVDGPPGSEVVDRELVLQGLRPLLEDPETEIINQNIKYDLLVLRRAGVRLQGLGLDPMIGDYLLDAGALSHGLDELSKRYLFRQMIPITDLIGSGKKQLQMFEVDVEKAAEYATEDADAAWQIAHLIEPKLKEQGLWELYWNLERPLIEVLAEMEWNGVRVDVDELRAQSRIIAGKLDALVAEIHEIAGQEFNINSPKQLQKILFEELQLPVLQRTKTGPSTNEDVLERLAEKHPLPAKIIEHRGLAKLKNTYLDTLPQLVSRRTGKVHTSFSQVTAATGRLSSSDPNLQNIPIRTEEGRQVRKAFIPSEPGWQLLCLDYSQIELRMLAHFCQDAVLLRAFQEGQDIHAVVAAQVYGVPVEEVTRDMRRVAKAVNFGVIYGQSPYGLAASLRISREDATEFIEDYFAKYPGVQEFMDRTLDECRRTGYARTILGRRREISGIRPKRFGNLNLPERTAVNTVIQGSAADLIKQAMLQVYRRLQAEGSPARLLLQIHDELVFEAPAEEIANLRELAQAEMESALPLSVPIVVDSKAGANWYEVG
jgi:DNA polymerase-1